MQLSGGVRPASERRGTREVVMALRDVTRILIVLTDRCNLNCAYCYQTATKSRSIPWEAVRAGIDFALKGSSPEIDLIFSGGEPLLDFDRLREAVVYADAARPPGKRVQYRISTNGLLLSQEIAGFLQEHEFTVQLSFDGIAAAQDCRAPGTFQILDQMLDSLRAGHPDLFARGLRVSMVVTPLTVNHMAESVAHFLRKDVRNIIIAPVIGHQEGWEAGKITELDAQIGAIAETCLRHLERTGEVPVRIFGKTRAQNREEGHKRRLCGGLRGTSLVVDADGQVLGCPLFSESCKDIRAGSPLSAVNTLLMGDIREPGLSERRAAACEAARLLLPPGWEERRHSSYGRCRDCEYFDGCSICPVSIVNDAQEPGTFRVPDFICAFNQAVFKQRERFHHASGKGLSRPRDSDPIAPLEAWLRAIRAQRARDRT